MDDIEFKLDENEEGAFFIEKNNERLAEMVISISGNELTVYHTEVLEKLRGQGIAAKLMAAMVAYARKNQLTVFPLCQFVSMQFKKQPGQYADLWKEGKK